jgi:hypothetical protein
VLWNIPSLKYANITSYFLIIFSTIVWHLFHLVLNLNLNTLFPISVFTILTLHYLPLPLNLWKHVSHFVTQVSFLLNLWLLLRIHVRYQHALHFLLKTMQVHSCYWIKIIYLFLSWLLMNFNYLWFLNDRLLIWWFNYNLTLFTHLLHNIRQ